MAIIRNSGKIQRLTGIPLSHIAGFQLVANQQSCIIMNRAVGTACTQLIEEGYSSKGFHVKAKSCNWGPMSGFVLEDPNLTKRKPNEKGKQSDSLEDAFDHYDAKSTPLYISEARRKHLVSIGAIVQRGGWGDTVKYLARQYPDQAKGSSSGDPIREYMFVLKAVNGAKLRNAPAAAMWAVRYADASQAEHVRNVSDGGAVHAMVNPINLGGRAGGVRNAMTGDYDLFSLAIDATLYRPGKTFHTDNNGNFRAWKRGKDTRMVGVDQLTSNIKNNVDPGEDVHLGNMSPRHHMIRNALNKEFKRRGYQGGNMVHHSDEAGRPFIEDVDLPVFAVVPNENLPFGIATLADLREFLNVYMREGQYVPFLNPGWISWLVGGKARRDLNLKQAINVQRQKMNID